VRFLCPACHQLLGISARKAGAQVNCPKCRSAIIVPPTEPGGLEPAAGDPAERDEVWAEAPAADKPPIAAPPVSGRLSRESSGSSGLGDDSQFIRLPRRMLYLQAILLAVVAIAALAAGYLIGSGMRLSGP